MPYDAKPWLKSYDVGVPATVEAPEISFPTHFDEIVAAYPDRPALHFYGTTLTFKQLQAQSNRVAQALVAHGCGPGDVVGINLPNIPQYLIAQVGAAKAGCASSGMSPLLTARELRYQLNDSKAKALFTLDAIFEHRLAGTANEIPALKLVAVAGILDYLPWIKRILGRLLKKAPHGKIGPLADKTVVRFSRILADYPDTSPEAAPGLDDPFLVQYTGGTTGVPKGTILTHRNLAVNQAQIETWTKPEYGSEVFLSGFPLFHLAGLAMGLAALATASAQVLIPNPRDTGFIVKQIAVYGPTVLVNVPSLYMMLMEDPGFQKLDFSSLKFCLSGASPFPSDSILELERIIGKGKVMEVYGLTESSPIITMNPRFGPKKIGSVGLPVSGTDVRLVDLENGTTPVPLREEGELIASGGQVMKGYLNKPEETSIALREHDGKVWLHTGDVARMDEDGFFYIVDRTKDMLNVGGFKVFSREVEEKLYEHPAIEFCAIIGLPNTRRPGTDIVKLVVQVSRSHRARNDEEVKADILSFARENFSPFKVPKIIEFVEEMPLTVVGKVDKKALRSHIGNEGS
ncbi:MAG: AMP-binding protein [Desulfomonilaceae bacterium]|nr:AMP-binding protein [Desulfomonilaceae bacterium]